MENQNKQPSLKQETKQPSKTKGAISRLIILAAIGGVVLFVGFYTGRIKEIPLAKPDFTAILNGLLLLVLLLIIEAVLSIVLTHIKPRSNRGKTLIALTRNILRYAVILAAICIVLTMLTVDIVTIVAGLGILALIIGFGAESLIADVVTGMFILIDNQYNIGDIIEVNGFRGTVTDISVRTTMLTDVGGNVKIINNSDMKYVLNRSDNTSRAVTDFPIPYDVDYEDLEKKLPAMLERIYEANTDIMKAVPVYAGIDQFADSSVNLRFVVEVAESDIYSGTRALNRALFIEMRKLGIEVPFPQVDVHQK